MDSSAWLPYAQARRVRVLAVMGAKRSSAFPDIPTMKEAGFAGHESGAQFGIYTTGGTPMNTVRRLNAEINRIITTSDITKSFAAIGMEPGGKTVEAFTQNYFADLAQWKDVVARAKIPMTD